MELWYLDNVKCTENSDEVRDFGECLFFNIKCFEMVW